MSFLCVGACLVLYLVLVICSLCPADVFAVGWLFIFCDVWFVVVLASSPVGTFCLSNGASVKSPSAFEHTVPSIKIRIFDVQYSTRHLQMENFGPNASTQARTRLRKKGQSH